MSSEPPTGFDADFLLACPFDGAKMDKVQIGSVTADRCTKCRGLWLDMNELHRILAEGVPVDDTDIGGALRATLVPSDKPVLCPRDHSELIVMSDRKQAHIKYHSCTVCGGMMLECGELKDLSEFSLTERIKSFFRM